MEEQANTNPGKPTYKKVWFWIIIIVAVVLIAGIALSIIGSNHDKYADEQKQKEKQDNQQLSSQEIKNMQEGRKPPMTDTELAAAEKALAAGISVADPNNDFAKMPKGGVEGDGRPDNSDPWPIDFVNFKNFQIGADDQYIYTKCQFWGTIPTDPFHNGDDWITGFGVNIALSNYFNHNLDKKDQSALMQIGMQYAITENFDFAKAQLFNPPKLNTSTFGEANSEVKDKNGEDTYGISTGEGKTYWKEGSDNFFAAFPLSNLGLQVGDIIKFSVSVESGSTVYHHQSIDPILDFGSAKSGKDITWKIGSNTYTESIPKI